MNRWLLIVLATILGGCAGHQAFQAGEELSRQGLYEQAFLQYAEAVSANPDRHEYRMRMQESRVKASRKHLETGRQLLAQGDTRSALAEFRQSASLDPSNMTANEEMKKVQALLRAEELTAEAEQRLADRKLAQAKSLLTEALRHADLPKARELMKQVRESEHRTIVDGMELDVASDKPITLKFRDTEIRDVFSILTKLSGINFIFDEDVRSQRISILLEDGTFAQALQLLLGMNNLEKKILNTKTIIIYPKTKDKDKKFDDHVIQIFYLSNIDAKKAVNLLRTMLQLRKIYVHEELNAIVLRDTPTVVRLAQQIIEAADRSDSEVVFDLELVEINHNDTLNLGPRLSSYATSFGFVEPGATEIVSPVTSSLSSLDFLYSLPTATFSFQKTLTDSEVLANPKIRVKNREKAKVHIGSREPIVTNTLTASGDVTSTNVQYVDVGVKLDVEPTIQLDNTIVTKLTLEVSSVSNRRSIGDGGQGGEALTITTTNAQTSLILQDGEQTVIGGLIRDDFTRGRDSIPLLGDIPLLGNLISGHRKEKGKREILLSIRPHIVKKVEVPMDEVARIWSGGEDDLQTTPRFGAFTTLLEAEAQKAPPAPAPGAAPAASGAAPAPLRPAAVSPAGKLVFAEPGPAVVGSEIVLTVQAAGMKNLHSAPLFVTYDAERLEFIRADEGDFLGANQKAVFSSAVSGEGELIIGQKQADGAPGASGNGVLFHLVFRGKTPGPARVTLERANFRDPQGEPFTLADEQIVVNVRQL